MNNDIMMPDGMTPDELKMFATKCCQTCFHNMPNRDTPGTHCDLSGKPTMKYQPICTRYVNTLEHLRQVEAEETRKTNFVLTLMFNSLSACMCFLSYFERRMKFFTTNEEWPKEKRLAMIKMRDLVGQLWTQYNRHFKRDIIRVTRGSADTKEEGDKKFNEVYGDTFEICQMLMAYVDHCFGQAANLSALMAFFEQLPSSDIIFDQKDYDEFKPRR